MKQEETFGKIIEKIMYERRQETLRNVSQKLMARGSKVTTTKLSKIIRGIQNPNNKQEFEDIMDVLEITEPERSRLEILANDFLPIKKLSDEEIMKRMPILIGKKINNPEELDSFLDTFKKIIIEDQEPEL